MRLMSTRYCAARVEMQSRWGRRSLFGRSRTYVAVATNRPSIVLPDECWERADTILDNLVIAPRRSRDRFVAFFSPRMGQLEEHVLLFYLLT